MIDERTERLMNRRLDGELNDDAALELNKRLIRTPEARALLEEYERNDRLAAQALRGLLTGRETSSQTNRDSVSSARRAWLGSGARAVAAALLLIVAIGAPNRFKTRPGDASAPLRLTHAPALATATPMGLAPPSVEGPRAEAHRLQRNVLGVWDEETDSIYVLELDQHAETVIPVGRNF